MVALQISQEEEIVSLGQNHLRLLEMTSQRPAFEASSVAEMDATGRLTVSNQTKPNHQKSVIKVRIVGKWCVAVHHTCTLTLTNRDR